MKSKGRLTQSQKSGIIWLVAVLTLFAAVKIFSVSSEEMDTEKVSELLKMEEKMQNKEDSVYRSRWTDAPSTRRTTKERKISSENAPLYTTAPPPATRRPLQIDLNNADTTTLQLLKGIGPAFARRIVRYRERLGGFVSVDQLLEVYGFTPALLDLIEPYIGVDSTSVRRMPVNSIGLKAFIKHPYVDYYFARDLINLRSHGVVFSGADDLRTIPNASDTLLERLLPYLEFSTAE